MSTRFTETGSEPEQSDPRETSSRRVSFPVFIASLLVIGIAAFFGGGWLLGDKTEATPSTTAAVTSAPPVIVTATPPSSVSTPTTSVSESSSANSVKEVAHQQCLDYMRSPERAARYARIWPAGTKVARALLNGKFGPTEKYTESKQPRPTGYSGWGGIQTTDVKQYAWVWWNRDGSINYSKGVLGFSLEGTQIDSEDFGEGPYKGRYFISDYSVIVEARNCGGTSPLSPYRYATTVDELRPYDEEVLSRMTASLRANGLN